MIKHFLLFIFLVTLSTGKLFSQWSTVNPGTVDDLYSVDYYSANDVWIGSYGHIAKTTNGGSSWSLLNPLKDNNNLTIAPINVWDLALTGSSNAIMTGFYSLGNTEVIYTTGNGGVTWNLTSQNTSVSLPRYLKALDVFGSNCVAVGNNGRIAVSSNSGNSWSFVNSGTAITICDVKFLSADTVFAVGNGLILKSTDRGTSWNPTAITGGFLTISGQKNVIYVGSATNHFMVKSTDYGATYTTLSAPSTFNGVLYAINKDTVLAAGSDGLYISKTGGQYWEKCILPGSYQEINMLDFLTANQGYAVGNAGYVIKTNNLPGCHSIPIGIIAIQGGNPNICLGDSITFINSTTPLSGYTYQWQLDGSPFSTQYNSGVRIYSTGSHTVSMIVHNAYGSDTASVTVNVTGHPLSNFSITSSTDTVCSGNYVSLSVPLSQSGATYQLRKGFTNVGTVQTGNGGTLTFSSGSGVTATTTYNIIAKKSNSCFSDSIINYKTIYLKSGSLVAACTPSYNYNGTYGIMNVSFGSINNTSTILLSNYFDYSCCRYTSVYMGRVYPLTITTANGGESVAVWLDYDNDGVYDSPSELVCSGASNASKIFTTNVTIPSLAILNPTVRMRVSSCSSYSQITNALTCQNYSGQAEDYAVTIFTDNTAPGASFTSSQTVVCNTTVVFANTSYNSSSYFWDFGDTYTSTLMNPSHIYTASGIYPVKLIAYNSYGVDTIIQNITINNPLVPITAVCNPTSYGGSCTRAYFSSFQAAGSHVYPGSSGFYHDYTCTNQLYLKQDSNYTMFLQTAGGCRAWIDFNNDGDFNDTNEELWSGTISGSPTITLGLSAPLTGVVCNAPLRFRLYTSGNPPYSTGIPCDNICGQYIEFTVFVIPTTHLHAFFDANSTVICKDDTVTFTNNSLNATSYLWDFGDGSTSSQTNPTHIYDSTGIFTVKLKANNATSSDSLVMTNYINVSPGIPGPVDTIFGLTTVCQNQSGVYYTINRVPNATSYIWTYPTGAWRSTGTDTSSRVTYGTSAISGNITVKAINGCGEGSLAILPVTVNTLPSAAGAISGINTVCKGQSGVLYSVPPIANAVSYTWTLPTGATGTSTADTIMVNYSATAVSGNITVKGTNGCGNGTAASLAITVKTIPSAAGTITGSATVCQGQTGVVYSVAAIANATTYIWSLPSGATGTSTTNSITLNYGLSAVAGNISVYGNSICGNGTASSKAIAVNLLPSGAGVISGITNVCQGQNAVTYTVPAITDATSYVWTLPGGVTGTSSTNSITVDFGTSALSGDITVKGHNSCGDGVPSLLAITINPLPSNAGTISGNTNVCQGQNSVVYTVPAINDATTYIWSLPVGASGSSSTNSITVDFGSSAVSGNISVYGNNTCGVGVSSILPITVDSIPANAGIISGSTTICQGQTGVVYSIPAITNATSYIWTLPSGATGTSITNSITVDYGYSALSGNITVKGHSSCGDGTSSLLAIVVNTAPSAPVITSPISYCQNATASPLSATGTNLLWYTSSTGGTGSSTAPTPSTSIVGTTSYYISQTVSGCEGPRATINVDVIALPSAPAVTTPVAYCQNAIASQLSATGTNLLWYTTSTGGTGSSIAPTPSTSIVGTSSYYVSQTVSGCEGPRATINIITNPIPTTPVITQNADTLYSNSLTGNQWYDQNGILIGENNQDLVVTAPGNYFVITNQNGCISDSSNIISVNFAPLTQAFNIIISNVTDSSFNVSWTSGAKGKTAIFVIQASSGTAFPVNNTTYVSNSIFGLGDQIGTTGWYCVYNGYNTNLLVTGLQPATIYRIMTCEYNGNGGNEHYNTSVSANNPVNQVTDIATNINNYSQEQFNIYPNPFNDNITISFTLYEATNFEINIYDMLGRKVILLDENNLSAGVHTVVLNADKFTNAEGIYYMEFITSKEKVFKKIIRLK